jgi:protein TonB
MATYAGTATRPDRAKAVLAVIAVHAALAFVILSGLSVGIVRQAVEHLTTIRIEDPPPPPPVQPPPKPAPRQKAMKRPEGAAAKKADPSPVVAPEPKLPAPSPVTAAKVAGTGSATTSGAAASGSGTGAGGIGNGLGGGGTGGFTPARKITKIPDSEYRRFRALGFTRGIVGLAIRVNADGTPSNCRIATTSGNPQEDALMCQLTLAYVRFSPALDPGGRPIAQDVTFYSNWWRP